jgi:hypothetical protein
MIILQPWFLSHSESFDTLEIRKSHIATVPVELPFLVPTLNSVRYATKSIKNNAYRMFAPRESTTNSLAANGKYVALIIPKDRHQVRPSKTVRQMKALFLASLMLIFNRISINDFVSPSICHARASDRDPRKRIRWSSEPLFCEVKEANRKSINPRNNVECFPSRPASLKTCRCDYARDQACRIIYASRSFVNNDARCTNNIARCSALRITPSIWISNAKAIVGLV